ncbi:hypothetical protein GTW71_04920 [Streptomyces sp. SID6041]|nr:hypothetical protein [Streptomyces sp. SID6041]
MADDMTGDAGPRPVVDIVRSPRAELVQLADTLDDCVGRFLQARQRTEAGSHWEAPREGWALSNLMIRNVEAVLLMARTDEVMVSAAWANARCAFEQAVRIIWLLNAADPYISECRWLGLLEDTERFHRLMAESSERDPSLPDSTMHHEREGKTRLFREGVIAALPPGYSPEKPPSFESMLRSIDSAAMYRFYREGSQYVHGSMWGTAAYRKNLGGAAEFGDFTSTVDWILPLRLSWLSIRNAGRVLLDRLAGGAAVTCDWDGLGRVIDNDFEALVQAIESDAR